ncbi:MAG: YXWGXW repeat-containing protein [Candidatus Eisenbacteria bacterium]|nr:YXWGXW repeat-containing protein [Candidatus Eisenbacteria bacterium]
MQKSNRIGRCALRLAITIVVLSILSAGCAVYTRPAPPSARVELRAAAPCHGGRRVAGHWRWEGKRIGYRWIPGHWTCR